MGASIEAHESGPELDSTRSVMPSPTQRSGRAGRSIWVLLACAVSFGLLGCLGSSDDAWPAPGVVLLDTRVVDQAVKVVRSDLGDRMCIRVETIGRDEERCIPREEYGRKVERFWFGAEVAPGHWVVLLATTSADPYWQFDRVEATTTDGQRFVADSIAGGTVVFLAVEGDLDHSYVWNTSDNLVQETWPSYERYW